MKKVIWGVIAVTMVSFNAISAPEDYTTGMDDVKRWYEENQPQEPHPEWVDSTKMPFDKYLGEVGKGMEKVLDSMLDDAEQTQGTKIKLPKTLI